MQFVVTCLVSVLFYLTCFTSFVQNTCVLESDFGFALNCNFKKSGLFRVRNLGGVKAHFGLGLSVGDELGFPESLGNLEGNKRRSLSVAGPTAGNIPNDLALRSKSDVRSDGRLHNTAFASKSLGVDLPEMTQASSLPLGVPAFRPISYNIYKNQTRFPLIVTSEGSNTLKVIPVLLDSMQPLDKNNGIGSMISADAHEFRVPEEKDIFRRSSAVALKPPTVDLKGHTIEELAAVANVSVGAIKSAIAERQKKLDEQYVAIQESQIQKKGRHPDSFKPNLITYARSPSLKDISKKHTSHDHKVMNAPKEYYPAGYEKNFDDNFTARVDLPPTPFHCGDQKHFPGLYADDNLGCMVFHVCALADDGLVMKSFLCPESTLFDQSILRCNWWFYVECENSKKLYESNMPVSKSYQLMKSLSYFSKYKNQS